MIPSHDQCARAAGTAAHRRPALGILVNFTLHLLFHQRQHFFLDELRIRPDMVSYSSPRSLPWASPPPLPMEMAIITGTRLLAIRLSKAVNNARSVPSAPTMKGATVPGRIASAHKPPPGGCREPGGWWLPPVWRGRRDPPCQKYWLASDAGINFAVSRTHGEVIHRSLRHTFLHGHFRRAVVSRANDEVSVGIRRRIGAVGQLFGRDITFPACADRGWAAKLPPPPAVPSALFAIREQSPRSRGHGVSERNT
jgi:hypothetical protein